MSTKEQILLLESILFESGDEHINIKGTIIQGYMQYETTLEINNTQLNYLINQLQKQNTDIEVYDYLMSTKLSDGSILYTADFVDLPERAIDLSNLEHLESIKEVRA